MEWRCTGLTGISLSFAGYCHPGKTASARVDDAQAELRGPDCLRIRLPPQGAVERFFATAAGLFSACACLALTEACDHTDH